MLYESPADRHRQFVVLSYFLKDVLNLDYQASATTSHNDGRGYDLSGQLKAIAEFKGRKDRTSADYYITDPMQGFFFDHQKMFHLVEESKSNPQARVFMLASLTDHTLVFEITPDAVFERLAKPEGKLIGHWRMRNKSFRVEMDRGRTGKGARGDRMDIEDMVLVPNIDGNFETSLLPGWPELVKLWAECETEILNELAAA